MVRRVFLSMRVYESGVFVLSLHVTPGRSGAAQGAASLHNKKVFALGFFASLVALASLHSKGLHTKLEYSTEKEVALS